jgi:hypothetical protein
MSCIKDTPVITMERLCEEKLKCWVCEHARKVRAGAAQPPPGPSNGPA